MIAPVLTKELHISPIEYSQILQAFLIAYTVMYLGSGFFVDRWGTRTSLAVFMIWWSISNVLHAFVRTGFGLGVFRLLLGLGEPGNFMASFKAISEWYPAKEKSVRQRLGECRRRRGRDHCHASGGMADDQLRVAFVVCHHRFVWAHLAYPVAVAVPLARPTSEHYRRANSNTFGRIMPPAFNFTPGMKRIDLLKFPQTWGLLLARFISDPVWWFYLFWLPKYLVDQRGFTIARMGMLAWLPYLCADLGSISGGIASGYLVKRFANPIHARAAAMLPCALVMLLSVAIGITPSSFVAISIICVVTFSHMAWKTNLMTMTNDIYPTRLVGSVSGIIAFGSGLGGTLFTSLTGWVVQHFSYTWIFVLMGFLHPTAYIIVRLLVKGPIEPIAAPVVLKAQEVTP